MLKHKTEIHDQKRDKLKKIETCLSNNNQGIGNSFHPDVDLPIMEPNFYLTLYAEVTDSTHRSGFVVDFDQVLKPIGARYFSSSGPSTYRESELNTDEFELIVEYYDLDKLNMADLIRNKVKVL